MMCRVNVLCPFALFPASQNSLAVTYPLPPEGSRLVRQSLTVTVPNHNTRPLETFAAQYGQGLSNMLEANPGADVLLPKPGLQFAIPQQLILPIIAREGIVVNVAEVRLYYCPPGSNTVEVFPIGIGQVGRKTLRDWVTTVERKQGTSTRTSTLNTRHEHAKRGESLPASAFAGPDNPTGLYTIYIGKLYAIHGTNANSGTGPRVSQGCIRLRNNNIKYLFDNVPVDTHMRIIGRPMKYTTEPGGSKWLEAHEPLSHNRAEYESDRKVPLPVTPPLRVFIDGQKVGVNRANAAL